MKLNKEVSNNFSPNSSLGFAFRNQNFGLSSSLSPIENHKKDHLSWFTKEKEKIAKAANSKQTAKTAK